MINIIEHPDKNKDDKYYIENISWGELLKIAKRLDKEKGIDSVYLGIEFI